jgi:hypothetical protein
MTKFLGLMIAVLFSSQAMAAQYEVYVTGSSHVSPAQIELTSIIQKQILIDSSTKSVRIQLSPVCNTGSLCPEYIRSVTLKLTNLKVSHGQVMSVRAEGNLDLNGKPTAAILQIDLNADNAMDIVITNSSECKSTHSNFIGSPATATASVLF